MKVKYLLAFLLAWLLLLAIIYYLPVLLDGIFWLLTLISLIIFSIRNLVKLINHDRNTKKKYSVYFSFFLALLILTFYAPKLTFVMENLDWHLFKSKRLEVVEKVKSGEYFKETSSSSYLYDLPFSIPVISHGGNSIHINKGKYSKNITIKFWVNRAIAGDDSKMFIYTNEPYQIKKLEILIKSKPEENWKLEKNWYRVYE